MIELIPIENGELVALMQRTGDVQMSFGPGGLALRYDTDKPLTKSIIALCKMRGKSAPEVSWWRTFNEV